MPASSSQKVQVVVGLGEDYSDFFEQLFGRARHAECRQRHEAIAANRSPSAAPITTPRSSWSCSTAYNGAERNISLRGAKLDASGHVVTEDRTLSVKIPKGRDRRPADPPGRTGWPRPRGRSGGRPVPRSVFQASTPATACRAATSRPACRWHPGKRRWAREIEVPTPTSRVQITVPAGWKKGRKLRLKGHGIPGRGATDPAGDMYLELELALPPG
jgi:curved DNA-binding protein